jgi:hypothetical protein
VVLVGSFLRWYVGNARKPFGLKTAVSWIKTPTINYVEEPGCDRNSVLQLLNASVSKVALVPNALPHHLIRAGDIGKSFRIILMVDTPRLDVHNSWLGCIADASIDSSLLFVGPQPMKYHHRVDFAIEPSTRPPRRR